MRGPPRCKQQGTGLGGGGRPAASQETARPRSGPPPLCSAAARPPGLSPSARHHLVPRTQTAQWPHHHRPGLTAAAAEAALRLPHLQPKPCPSLRPGPRPLPRFAGPFIILLGPGRAWPPAVGPNHIRKIPRAHPGLHWDPGAPCPTPRPAAPPHLPPRPLSATRPGPRRRPRCRGLRPSSTQKPAPAATQPIPVRLSEPRPQHVRSRPPGPTSRKPGHLLAGRLTRGVRECAGGRKGLVTDGGGRGGV